MYSKPAPQFNSTYIYCSKFNLSIHTRPYFCWLCQLKNAIFDIMKLSRKWVSLFIPPEKSSGPRFISSGKVVLSLLASPERWVVVVAFNFLGLNFILLSHNDIKKLSWIFQWNTNAAKVAFWRWNLCKLKCALLMMISGEKRFASHYLHHRHLERNSKYMLKLIEIISPKRKAHTEIVITMRVKWTWARNVIYWCWPINSARMQCVKLEM